MVVVLVCMAGLCCGIINLKTTQDFNQRLQDVITEFSHSRVY